MELTEEQKIEILAEFESNPNPKIMDITRKVYRNPAVTLKGPEIKEVRKFLKEVGMSVKPGRKKTTDKPVEDIGLDDDQKKFIANSFGFDKSSPVEIARALWPEKNIRIDSKETKLVAGYVSKLEGKFNRSENDNIAGIAYKPPESFAALVVKVNKIAGSSINPMKPSAMDKKNLDALLTYMGGEVFRKNVEVYDTESDRNAFEEEFIRLTWDKNDLTSDERSMYCSACAMAIESIQARRHKSIFTSMLDNVKGGSDDDKMINDSMRYVNLIKAKSEEADKLEKQKAVLINKLNGDRQARMKSRQENKANILSLVNLLQEEDERQRLVKMRMASQERVRKEADRLEEFPDYIARVLGISKDDVL